MEVELRPVSVEEFPAFVRTDNAAFGFQPSDDQLQPENAVWPLDRTLAAFSNGAIVGTAAAYPFELTLPGLEVVPAAGVSWVGVLPTHRRRGLLSHMMRRQLSDTKDRGEPVAILLASESLIYGRFGYGLATTQVDWELDRRHRTVQVPFEPAGGLRLVDLDEARKVLPTMHDEARRLHPGDVSRTAGWWNRTLHDDAPRHGMGPRFHVVYEGASKRAEGFASYRIRQEGAGPLHGTNTVVVEAMFSTTPDAYFALWSFVTDIDLTDRVQARFRPIEEPLRHRLADPRRLRAVRAADYLWLRLVDLPAALSARRYSAPVRVVLEVIDEVCPWNDGRWVLEAGPDGARCSRSDAEPDVTLGVATLGAAFLGGTRLTTLARAGRVDERTPGTVLAFDLALVSDPPPWCGTFF